MRGTILFAAALAAGPVAVRAETTVIDPAAAFPEGPVLRDGVLLYAQYGGNVVSAWDGTAVTTLWTGDGCGPSAVAPLGGDLAVTCYDNGTLVRVGADGATLATYAADSAGGALVGPNDLAPDGSGGLYVTASGPWESAPIVGKVYHLGADGSLRMLADDLHYANGIALWNGRLYVNESEAGRVISFAVGADGSLSDRRLFVRVAEVDAGSPGSYPDGLKVGPDGNLWIGQYSAGRIVVVAADGSLVRTLDVDAPAAPNLAFSADGRTVYVMVVDDTAAAPYRGRVLALPVE
jgi:sugar lactone lactonase YvrE